MKQSKPKSDSSNYKEYLTSLTEYISFPSISTDETYKPEIEKTVSWLSSYMRDFGCDVSLFQSGKTNPVVFASLIVDDNLPTLLIYGHYDVQPAVKSDGWSTNNPFIIQEKKGKLIARGIVDNKGQNLIHLHTVKNLYTSGNMGYNIKFLIEGNEESGNPDLAGILEKNKELFAADYVLVSDGEIVQDYPVIEHTLRGGGNIRVVYKTATNNLHSGIYGGAVPSASMSLVEMLSTLKDKENRVSIDGFYDGVTAINTKTKKNNITISKFSQTYKDYGIKKLQTIDGLDFFSQTGLLPTIEISGIQTGYTGNGFCNIVPGYAEARINFRVAPGQSAKKIVAKILKHIKKNTPNYVQSELFTEDYSNAIELDITSAFAEKIKKHLGVVYNKEVLVKNVGGSIPILGDFKKILRANVISVSLGNDDCNMHGVDENYTIDLIKKGLLASAAILKKE